MVKELGEAIWLYPFSSFDDFDGDITPGYLVENESDLKQYKNVPNFPIWNTPESVEDLTIRF